MLRYCFQRKVYSKLGQQAWQDTTGEKAHLKATAVTKEKLNDACPIQLLKNHSSSHTFNDLKERKQKSGQKRKASVSDVEGTNLSF